jgi:hypothetical protein
LGFSEFEFKKYQLLLEDYIESIRPPIEMRERLDIAYRIEKQSIYIFEVRPEFQNPKSKIEIEVAKATFVRTQNHWNIFWMRSDLKWHGYEPDLFVDSLEEVIETIKSDDYGCFWG